MPPKIKQLTSRLAQAGFVVRKDRGKGSHTMWTHPSLPGTTVVLAVGDGDDAKAYQERDVREALAALDRASGDGDR